MDFKILGPLEVHDGDRQVACRGEKQRLLLATLLLNSNTVVSSDELTEALWGGRPPGNPAKALQMQVSGLRKLLARDVLVTRPPGYELRVRDGELDLAEFERIVGEARAALRGDHPREAAGLLSDALSLWRGPPLADLSFEVSLQEELARLEELRLTALEDRIEADLAVGRHADVSGELEALASKYPLRERLRGQLMLALYRSGRQAEALEVYRDTRSALVDELGIEPGRALKELERAILTQDASLDPEREVEPAPGLVGREREQAKLQPVLDAALAGSPALILIAGEPGIGKSRLAEALAERGRTLGARLAVGRCWEAGGAPAYWPWVQALRSYARGIDPAALSGYVEHGAADVATLVPELKGTDAPPAESLEDQPPSARFRLFDAVAAFLRNAATAEPLVLVLDDLHAADASSLLLLRFVVEELDDAPIAVLGCYRDTEVGADLGEALAQLTRAPAVCRVSLKGLGVADTGRLLELHTGQAPPGELAARVHVETEGNPLFAGEVARLLGSEEYSQHEGRLPLPDGVREAIRSRLRRQSAACSQALTLASALGREFDLDVLGRLSSLEPGELFDAVEEAVDARLVGEIPGGGGRLRFSHVLIRDVLYEDLPVAQRMALHHEIAELLEDVYRNNPDPHLAELAHHYIAAGSAQAEKAMQYSTRAGERAASQLGYEEAARHYASALRLAETADAGDASRICELLLSLGEVLSRAGDGAAAKNAYRRAADIAESSGDAVRLARAALGYRGRFHWTRAGSDSELVPLLERALAGLDPADSPARVRLLIGVASALRDYPTSERRFQLAEDAVAMARRIGDPVTLGYALAGHWPAVGGPHNIGTRMGAADELIELSHRIGDPELTYVGHDYRLNTLWQLADRAGVEVEMDALETLVEKLRQPVQRWHFGAIRVQLALLDGRFDDAEALIADSVELGNRAQRWNAVVSQRMQLFVLRRAQGRLAELEDLIRRSVHEYPSLIRFQSALAHLEAELGREREAREAFDDLLARDLAREHLDEEWLLTMSFLPAPCAFLGDRRAAERLYELLLPFEHLQAQAPLESVFGAIARGLGVLAAVTRSFEDAERHLEAAIETERRMGARPWLAHAQHDLAEVLAARGDPGRARTLAGEAQRTYRELGMQSWAERAAPLS